MRLLYFSLSLVFIFIITINFIINKQQNSHFKNVKSIILPTIRKEQSYYFAKVEYENYSFEQLIRTEDHISNQIKKEGKWSECQEIFNLWKLSNKNGIFLDCGANIGSCSFLFAEAGVEVVLFEPLSNNLFPFTVTTLSNPKFKELITIYPYGLGSKNKKEVIHINKYNWGASSIYFDHPHYSEAIQINT